MRKMKLTLQTPGLLSFHLEKERERARERAREKDRGRKREREKPRETEIGRASCRERV